MSFPKWADENAPAATGSGEPKIKLCERGHLQMRGDENGCLRCAYEDANGVPTPPASQPTVIARAAELLEELKGCSMSSGAQVRVSELRDIVALLRAAEQK